MGNLSPMTDQSLDAECDASMKRIYTAHDVVEAEIVRERLAAAGISCIIKGELAAIAPAPFPTLWVADDDEAEASAILADDEAG